MLLRLYFFFLADERTLEPSVPTVLGLVIDWRFVPSVPTGGVVLKNYVKKY